MATLLAFALLCVPTVSRPAYATVCETLADHGLPATFAIEAPPGKDQCSTGSCAFQARIAQLETLPGKWDGAAPPLSVDFAYANHLVDRSIEALREAQKGAEADDAALDLKQRRGASGDDVASNLMVTGIVPAAVMPKVDGKSLIQWGSLVEGNIQRRINQAHDKDARRHRRAGRPDRRAQSPEQLGPARRPRPLRLARHGGVERTAHQHATAAAVAGRRSGALSWAPKESPSQ